MRLLLATVVGLPVGAVVGLGVYRIFALTGGGDCAGASGDCHAGTVAVAGAGLLGLLAGLFVAVMITKAVE